MAFTAWNYKLILNGIERFDPSGFCCYALEGDLLMRVQIWSAHILHVTILMLEFSSFQNIFFEYLNVNLW